MNENLLAGGGNFDGFHPPQQQTAISGQPQIIVVEDGGPWIITGVVVPLVIALVGWWLQRRWKDNHPGMKFTWKNIKKSHQENS